MGLGVDFVLPLSQEQEQEREDQEQEPSPKYTRRKHPRGLKFGKKHQQNKPKSCSSPPYINPALPLQKNLIHNFSDPNIFLYKFIFNQSSS